MIRTDYDQIAHLYDEDPLRAKPVDRRLVEYLAQAGTPKPGAIRILDMACGTGSQLVANKEAFPEIEMCGLDRFEGMLEQARGKSRDITWLQGNMDSGGLSLGQFDYVSCHFAYHHSRDKLRFFKNAHRSTRVGGWFSLVNLDAFSSDEWFIYRFFPAARTIDRRDFLTTESLIEMAEGAGFVVTACGTQPFREKLPIQEVARRCGRRHSYSELMSLADRDYQAGLSSLRALAREDPTATIQSSLTILDVVLQRAA